MMREQPDGALERGERAEAAGDLAAAAAAYRDAAEQGAATPGEASFRLGRVAFRQGHYDDALRAFEQARAAAMQHEDGRLRAQAENGIGAVHYAAGAYAQARAAYQVALALTGDPLTQGKIRLNLGVIANIEGDFDAARAHYLRSRAIFQQLGDESNEALALHNIGMLHADRGEQPEAEEAYARCLALCERQGNRQMVGNVLVNRSELLAARGALDEAVASCDLALRIYAELGDVVGRGEALRWKGHALRRLARAHAAHQCLTEAVRIAIRIRGRLLEAEAARELGLLPPEQVAPSDARRWLERALALFTTLGAQRDARETAERLAELGGERA